MNILIVEKDMKNVGKIREMIASDVKDGEVLCFDNSPAALSAARNTDIDTAFIGMTMPEMDGLCLGRYLKDLNPRINLIYLTEDKSDAFDAMALRASGCVLQPYTKASVKREMDELRYAPDKKNKNHVFAQTFGNFDIFVDGEPILFKYSKAKEILALLINNRGAQTTNGEIIASLWEDDGDPERKASYLSNLRQDLQNTLTKYGVSDIIVKQRGSMAIATKRIDCDLFDWLINKKKSRYIYMGDYMNQYSWAETVHAELDEMLDEGR